MEGKEMSDEAVLEHVAKVSARCTAASIHGPLTQSLLHQWSTPHHAVPEFSAFWSSTPFTAAISKKYTKLAFFFLALSMTASVPWTKITRDLTERTAPCSSGDGKTMVGARATLMAVRSIYSDTRESGIQNPSRLPHISNAGLLAGDVTCMISDRFTNYTVLRANTPNEPDLHYLELQPDGVDASKISMPPRYVDLAQRFSSSSSYHAFVELLEDVYFVDSNPQSIKMFQRYMQDQGFADFRARLHNESARSAAIETASLTNQDLKHSAGCARLPQANCEPIKFEWGTRRSRGYQQAYLHKVTRAADGVDRIVLGDNPAWLTVSKYAQIVVDWLWLLLAIGLWSVWISCMLQNVRAVKLSLLALFIVHFTLLVLPYGGSGMHVLYFSLLQGHAPLSWETLRLHVVMFHKKNGGGSEAVGPPQMALDSAQGEAFRRRLCQEAMWLMASNIARGLLGFALLASCWAERYLLVSAPAVSVALRVHA